MGRQGGQVGFTGSFDDINCYFDGGAGPIARLKSSLTRARWLSMPTLAAQREATLGFGAASVIAARLWKGLPAGMRRLADGNGYGRLVGHCRQWIGPDGQLWDVDLLRGFDFRQGAGGPHRMVPDGAGGWRLEGMDRLVAEIAAAEGLTAGMMPAPYVVAEGFGPRHRLDECRVDLDEATLRRQLRGEDARKAAVAQPDRRVRVWVHATRVVDTVWDAYKERYVTQEFQCGNGFVTDWLALDEAAGAYAVSGGAWQADWLQDGVYAVFVAVEVAEKRGRHWVRLPWCTQMRVAEVVEVTEVKSEQLKVNSTGDGVRRVGYVDAGGNVVEVMGWPAVGGELEVWPLEDLLPPARLVACACAETEVASGGPVESVPAAVRSPAWDSVLENNVLMEYKVVVRRAIGVVVSALSRAGP